MSGTRDWTVSGVTDRLDEIRAQMAAASKADAARLLAQLAEYEPGATEFIMRIRKMTEEIDLAHAKASMTILLTIMRECYNRLGEMPQRLYDPQLHAVFKLLRQGLVQTGAMDR